MTTVRKPRRPAKTAEQRCSEADHLITRLTERTCPRCSRSILSGHVMGEPTRIDRTRLSRDGELFALASGLKTFQRNVLGSTVFRRRGTHINKEWPKYGYVLAEHRCETRWAVSHYEMREIFPQPKGDQCPF